MILFYYVKEKIPLPEFQILFSGNNKFTFLNFFFIRETHKKVRHNKLQSIKNNFVYQS